jgi:hypothetical protein
MLRVFAGFTDTGMCPETYRALVKYVPIGSLELVNVTGDLSAYWQEFRKRWNSKHDLMTVEQDNVITGEVIPSFNACPHPWCVYEYEGPPNMIARGASDCKLRTSLGCTRFSQKLIADVPIEDISARDYFAWYLIDYRVACVLGKKGYKPHVHGEVAHLHNYTTDRGKILKEDEIYKESVNKTKKDPTAVLGHAGMEIEDGNPTWDGVVTYDKDSDAETGIAKKEPATGQ